MFIIHLYVLVQLCKRTKIVTLSYVFKFEIATSVKFLVHLTSFFPHHVRMHNFSKSKCDCTIFVHNSYSDALAAGSNKWVM